MHSPSRISSRWLGSFIINYAEDHAILLPGRIPGYKQSDLQLQPCSTTRHSVWLAYCAATTQLPTIHCVAYLSFCHIWRQLLPHTGRRSRTDLCLVCHSRVSLIVRSSNLSEAEKSQVHNSKLHSHHRHSGHMRNISARQQLSVRLTRASVRRHRRYIEST